MKVRPGPVLIGLAISAVVFAGAAFYSPVAAKAIPLVCVAAVVLAVYDRLWLARHRGDLSVTQIAPQVAGRDAPFEVALRVRCVEALRVRGLLRTVVPAEAEPRIWICDFRREGIPETREFRSRFRIGTRAVRVRAAVNHAQRAVPRTRGAVAGRQHESREGLS